MKKLLVAVALSVLMVGCNGAKADTTTVVSNEVREQNVLEVYRNIRKQVENSNLSESDKSRFFEALMNSVAKIGDEIHKS